MFYLTKVSDVPISLLKGSSWDIGTLIFIKYFRTFSGISGATIQSPEAKCFNLYLSCFS